MDRPILSMGTILRNEMAARGESPYGFAEHFPMPIADAIELLSNSAELQTWQMEILEDCWGIPVYLFWAAQQLAIIAEADGVLLD